MLLSVLTYDLTLSLPIQENGYLDIADLTGKQRIRVPATLDRVNENTVVGFCGEFGIQHFWYFDLTNTELNSNSDK